MTCMYHLCIKCMYVLYPWGILLAKFGSSAKILGVTLIHFVGKFWCVSEDPWDHFEPFCWQILVRHRIFQSMQSNGQFVYKMGMGPTRNILVYL